MVSSAGDDVAPLEPLCTAGEKQCYSSFAKSLAISAKIAHKTVMAPASLFMGIYPREKNVNVIASSFKIVKKTRNLLLCP